MKEQVRKKSPADEKATAKAVKKALWDVN